MALNKDELLDAIAGMTVLELSELIKAMEEKFGVSAAAAAVAVAAPAAGGAAAPAAEEKTEFTVILKAGFPADKKIAIIKEVRGLPDTANRGAAASAPRAGRRSSAPCAGCRRCGG